MARSQIILEVTDKKVGYSWMKNWKNEGDGNRYLVPTYQMNVYVQCGREKRWVGAFEVVRFGIDSAGWGGSGSICGLSDAQDYKLRWWGDYPVHSVEGAPGGGWIIFGDYLVHAGPENPRDAVNPFGATGCIEVCGPGQWAQLNGTILKELSLDDLGRANVRIEFRSAPRPGLYSCQNTSEATNALLSAFIQEQFGGKQPPGLSSVDNWGVPACYGGGQIVLCSGDPCPPPPKPDQAPQARIRDPLLVNLDGNGIRTLGLDAGIHFDLDTNGFMELTGWVAPGSGVLMLDGNGSESLDSGRDIFGDFTLLPNGMRAANGFEALAQYDSNNDGKIDTHDPIWSQLKIWRHDEFGERGFFMDPDLSGQINTLDELGIVAIYLDSQITNRTDNAGNTELRSGQFEWADGRTGEIAEVSLQRNTAETIPAEYLEVPSDIAALPDLYGYGDVYDLQQAMVRDSCGQLEALVQAFVAEDNPANRAAILDQIIFKWTGADSVASDARGQFMDGPKVVALKKFYGDSPMNPDAAIAVLWEETYRELFERFYGSLMAQTHLKDLYDKITYTWDDGKQQYITDMSGAIAELQTQLTNNPEQGRVLLSEFARSMRGLGHSREDCLACREIFIQQDPSLGWVIDTGGLPIYETPPGYGHVNTSNDSEAIQASLIYGDGAINGWNGNDVIYGTSRNERLTNDTGDALLVGGGGNDTIWAGPGADILDGGEGNDTLMGETGNDTYIFRRGSGQDTIIDADSTPGNIDTIWLGSNLTPEDITLRRSENNIVLRINDTNDTLTIKDFFRNNSPLNRVEQIQFMDGTVWNEDDIMRESQVPTDGDDIFYGTSGNDTIYRMAA